MKNKLSNSGLKAKVYQNMMGYAFITPALLFFCIFTVIPIVMAIGVSFTNYDFFSNVEFIGIENYKKVFADGVFLTTLKNILFYVAMFVPIIIIVSLLLAALLNSKVKGVKIFRAIYYLPGLTSAVASSVVWLWLLNPQYGMINQILGFFHIVGPTWLGSTHTAMISIVMITAWAGLGGNTVIYLAAMQGLSTSYYESAQIDGATKMQMFWKITVPLLKPTTYFILTMTLIGSFQLFDQAYVLTQGGPANSTLTPVYLIYNNAFSQLKMGYASAQSIVLFAIILVITLSIQKLNKDSNI